MFNELLELFIKYLYEYEFNAADIFLKWHFEHCTITDDQHEFCYWLKEFRIRRDDMTWDNLEFCAIHLNIPVYRKIELNELIMIVINGRKYFL